MPTATASRSDSASTPPSAASLPADLAAQSVADLEAALADSRARVTLDALLAQTLTLLANGTGGSPALAESSHTQAQAATSATSAATARFMRAEQAITAFLATVGGLHAGVVSEDRDSPIVVRSRTALKAASEAARRAQEFTMRLMSASVEASQASTHAVVAQQRALERELSTLNAGAVAALKASALSLSSLIEQLGAAAQESARRSAELSVAPPPSVETAKSPVASSTSVAEKVQRDIEFLTAEAARTERALAAAQAHHDALVPRQALTNSLAEAARTQLSADDGLRDAAEGVARLVRASVEASAAARQQSTLIARSATQIHAQAARCVQAMIAADQAVTELSEQVSRRIAKNDLIAPSLDAGVKRAQTESAQAFAAIELAQNDVQLAVSATATADALAEACSASLQSLVTHFGASPRRAAVGAPADAASSLRALATAAERKTPPALSLLRDLCAASAARSKIRSEISRQLDAQVHAAEVAVRQLSVQAQVAAAAAATARQAATTVR